MKHFKGQGGKNYPSENKQKIMKANWIDYILRTNWLLKHVTVRKI